MQVKRIVLCAWLPMLLVAYGASAQQQPSADDSADALFAETQEPKLKPYEAKVAVESQTDLLRQRAMSQGLREVIVNLLGSETALSEPEIVRALRSPQQYVAQFSYVRDYPEPADDDDDNDDSFARTAETEEQPQLQTFLSMQFLQGRVDGLLQAANQIEVGELQNIALAVQGIADFADYASTLTALQGLAMVREVSPVLVQAETIDFTVQFEGDVERFTAALEDETRLQSLDAYFDPVFDDQLNYELRPEIININD